MPPVTRKGDSALDYACFPAASSISASLTVHIDDIRHSEEKRCPDCAKITKGARGVSEDITWRKA